MNTPAPTPGAVSELLTDGLLPMPKPGRSYTEAEHAEFDKNEQMLATNPALARLRAPYAHTIMSLRMDVDFGGYDGHGKDELHHAAADAIEQLLVALQSQIEISNAERAQAERLASAAPVTEGAQREAVAEFVAFCADINHAYTFTDWSTFYRLRNKAIDELELSRLRSAPPPPDRVQPERVEAVLVPREVVIDAISVLRVVDDGRKKGIKTDPASPLTETILRRLVAAPPTDASGGVTEDEIVTRLYRRFKDWCKRGFGPDDVTWCEVKADVHALIEAADRARKPGYRQVIYADLHKCLQECQDKNELGDVVDHVWTWLRSIGAVIPEASREPGQPWDGVGAYKQPEPPRE